MTKIKITEDEKLKRQNQWSSPNLSSESHPLTEESAGDDECDVDGVTAHNDPVKPFEYASTGSSSCWIHGEMRESLLLAADLCARVYSELEMATYPAKSKTTITDKIN